MRYLFGSQGKYPSQKFVLSATARWSASNHIPLLSHDLRHEAGASGLLIHPEPSC